MMRKAIVAHQAPSVGGVCGLSTGGKAAKSQPAGTLMPYKTMESLAVIFVLIVAPGMAAIIWFVWLAGVVSSLLALLMR